MTSYPSNGYCQRSRGDIVEASIKSNVRGMPDTVFINSLQTGPLTSDLINLNVVDPSKYSWNCCGIWNFPFECIGTVLLWSKPNERRWLACEPSLQHVTWSQDEQLLQRNGIVLQRAMWSRCRRWFDFIRWWNKYPISGLRCFCPPPLVFDQSKNRGGSKATKSADTLPKAKQRDMCLKSCPKLKNTFLS